MLAAATAGADAGFPAHDFRDKAKHVTCRRKEVAVAAMVRKDRVARLEELGYNGPGELLANTRVHGTGDLALLVKRQ